MLFHFSSEVKCHFLFSEVRKALTLTALGPITFIASPDFTSRCVDCRADTRGHFNCLSVGNKQSNNHWAQEKNRGASKNFRGGGPCARIRPHLQIASDATAVSVLPTGLKSLLRPCHKTNAPFLDESKCSQKNINTRHLTGRHNGQRTAM